VGACPRLRELKIWSGQDPSEHAINTILSIRSTAIEKIIFVQSTAPQLPADGPYWTKLDDHLCELVNRFNPVKLEVEFQVADLGQGGGPKDDEEAYLPRFRKRITGARVKFVNREGEVIHFQGKSGPLPPAPTIPSPSYLDTGGHRKMLGGSLLSYVFEDG
jgi:hypothetical protein